MPTQGSLLIHGGIEAVLAIAMINCAICNNGNKTLSMRRYSARLTIINQKQSDSKDYARLYKWRWLDIILQKKRLTHLYNYKSVIKLIIAIHL